MTPEERRVRNRESSKRTYQKYKYIYRDKKRAQIASVREELKNRFGNRCAKCGATEHLEFHHLIRGSKDFDLANSFSYGRDKLEKEIDKCILLCRTCHRKLHAAQGDLKGRKKRPVLCIDTNKTYNSINACARDVKLSASSIADLCESGSRSRKTGYRFKFA